MGQYLTRAIPHNTIELHNCVNSR